MNKLFWSSLWGNLIRVHSPWGVLSSFVVGILLWYYSKDATMASWIFIIVVYILVLFLVVLISTSYEQIKRVISLEKAKLPNILIVRTTSGKTICLLEPSILFSIGISVSFFYKDEDNFEQFICIGKVLTIQEDEKIQVLIERYVEGHNDIIEKLQQGNISVLTKTKIKPSVQADF
jgi:hypothetical protein